MAIFGQKRGSGPPRGPPRTGGPSRVSRPQRFPSETEHSASIEKLKPSVSMLVLFSFGICKYQILMICGPTLRGCFLRDTAKWENFPILEARAIGYRMGPKIGDFSQFRKDATRPPVRRMS